MRVGAEMVNQGGGVVGKPKAAASVARLEQLESLLDKNRETYYRAIEAGRGVSARFYGWMDEYDNARGTAQWLAFCEKNKHHRNHTALDVLA